MRPVQVRLNPVAANDLSVFVLMCWLPDTNQQRLNWVGMVALGKAS
jgi:hypothetical protein